MINVGELIVTLGLDSSAFDKGTKDAEKGVEGFGSKVGGILKGAVLGGAVAAGAAIAGIGIAAFNVSSEISQATNNIQAQLGVTSEEAKALGDTAVDVFKNNFAGSITEASEAVTEVQRQLGDLASADDLQGITENAFRLKDAFGTEVPESINAVKTLMTNFGLTSQEAFDFIAAGQQKGLNSSGDFLETIGEYSTQFSNGGASADQFFSLLESGLQGGMLGTDKAADAFKEFRVRIQDGSKTTADGLAQLGINAEQLGEQMASGQVTAADAFQLVITKLQGIDDENLRMQTGVALLGTQFEDLGTDAVLALDLTKTKITDLAGSTSSLDVQYQNLGAVFEGFKRQALLSLAPIGDKLLEFANAIMPTVTVAFNWLSENLPIIIDTAATAIGTFVEYAKTTFAFLASFVEGNGNETSGFFADTWKTITDIVALAVDLINVTIVPAFKAIAKFIDDNQDTIKTIIGAVWTIIKNTITTALGVIQGIIKLVLALIKGDWQGAWNAIKEIVSTILNGIKTNIGAILSIITALLSSAWSSIKTTALTTWESIKNGITTSISNAKAGLDSIVENIKTGLSTSWNTIKSTATLAWNAMKAIINDPIGSAKRGLDIIVDSIKSALSSAWESVKSTASSKWESVSNTIKDKFDIKGKIEGIISDVKSALSGAWNDIKSGASSAWEGIANAIGDAFDGVTSKIRGIVNQAIDYVNRLISAYNEVADVLGLSSLSRISRLARGTLNFAGGNAIVGEFGPELVTLPRGSKVTPAQRTESLLSNNNGGKTINFNQYVTQLVSPEQELAMVEAFVSSMT